MNESLISIQENFKNWGGGEQDFHWLPEIFAGYQLFLNSWNPGYMYYIIIIYTYYIAFFIIFTYLL